ncbi:probable cyclin-dependent serine/threonine-protein kinase DDB_G0292550 isoform X1 [Mercenaria mercenaria]|uniref:probable cyclin-dependent serine/threonine-protein kinase DDB_G0292550 isoform X1 n=1 Tax=Mercenaria mercenaria TaxID=6596 RepID=UPI00234EBBC1|nr:probable cyclin-dependent serine/threonine-protein kinase DDB_G0292550 isoform X1 [Mercenaria mercenaria]
MKSNDFTPSNEKGGAKKFLYTGPKKGNDDDDDDLPWNFNAKKQSSTGNQTGSKFELDNVWSIQRNVNINGGVKQPKAESLHYNTNKSYYSRHGGGSKDKDEFGPSFGGSSTARNDNSGTLGNSDTGGKTWGVGSQTSRRPFSYAYGNDLQNPSDKSVSPRNTSVSSTGVYPQTGGSHFGSKTGSEMTSGNLNAFRGGNFNKQGSGNIFSSESTDSFASTNNNNSSVYNKSLVSSSSPGASNSYNPTQRNSLFSSSAQKNPSQNGLFNVNSRSSFESGSSGRQNKSFW